MLIKTILKKDNKIISNTYETIGNDLIYYEDNVKVTIKVTDNIEILRENEEYILKMLFINNRETNAIFTLKENNLNLNLKIFTNIIDKTNNKIRINYTLNDEIIDFTIYKEDL